jgi:hypothetical protein
MTRALECRWPLVFTLTLILDGFVSAYPQTVAAPSEKLGQLEITVSKVERFSMIADRFDGVPSSYDYVGRIYLLFKNVGDFPVCALLVPSVEEYEGAKWQYTQPIKTGFAYNPQIENLKAGAETSGYYDFRPSPQKRDYVLVLRQAAQTQKCGKKRETRNTRTSDAPTVRFSPSGIAKQ